MAFDIQNFVRSSAGEYSNSQVQADYKYNGLATDTKAAIIAADFFLDVYSQLVVGSMVTFTASDADLTLAYVTASSSTTVTLAEITETLPPGSVDTADIADLAVTTAKIALLNIDATLMADDAVSGDVIADLGVAAGKYAAGSIEVDDMVTGVGAFYNAIHITAGGSVTEAISIPGITATSVNQVCIAQVGATPVTIVHSQSLVDSLEVEFSADPSSDTVINVTVFLV